MGRIDNPPYYISAYGMAVAGGYTGTPEEFARMLAGLEQTLESLQEQIRQIVALSVPDGSITTAKLHDGAVTGAKLGSLAVTAAKLAAAAVETVKLHDEAVTAAKLAEGSVETAKIYDGAVTEAKLAAHAVTHEKTSGLQKQHSAVSVEVPAISAGGTQTVTVPGVTEDNTVIVSPAAAGWEKWTDCGARCIGQGAGTLSFTAESATGETISVNVLILD